MPRAPYRVLPGKGDSTATNVPPRVGNGSPRVRYARAVGLFGRQPRVRLSQYATARLAGKPLACHLCGATIYQLDTVEVHTRTAQRWGELFRDKYLELICTGCGLVQQFAGGRLETTRIPLKEGATNADGVAGLDLPTP